MNELFSDLEVGNAVIGVSLYSKLINASKGRGVFCSSVIKTHIFLGIYPGPIITAEAAHLLEKQDPDATECYLFFFDAKPTDYVRTLVYGTATGRGKHGQKPITLCYDASPPAVDYSKSENSCGLFNHSKNNPNMHFEVNYLQNGCPVICFFASRDIQPSTELVFDYNDRRKLGKELSWLNQ